MRFCTTNALWRVFLDDGRVRTLEPYEVAGRWRVCAGVEGDTPREAVDAFVLRERCVVHAIIPPGERVYASAHVEEAIKSERERCAQACRNLGDGAVNDAPEYAEAAYDCEATILEQRPVYRPRTPRTEAVEMFAAQADMFRREASQLRSALDCEIVDHADTREENERMREVLTACLRALSPRSNIWTMHLVDLIDGVLYPHAESPAEPSVGWDANGSEVL